MPPLLLVSRPSTGRGRKRKTTRVAGSLSRCLQLPGGLHKLRRTSKRYDLSQQPVPDCQAAAYGQSNCITRAIRQPTSQPRNAPARKVLICDGLRWMARASRTSRTARGAHLIAVNSSRRRTGTARTERRGLDSCVGRRPRPLPAAHRAAARGGSSRKRRRGRVRRATGRPAAALPSGGIGRQRRPFRESGSPDAGLPVPHTPPFHGRRVSAGVARLSS
jgi:hypothetical protein